MHSTFIRTQLQRIGIEPGRGHDRPSGLSARPRFSESTTVLTLSLIGIGKWDNIPFFWTAAVAMRLLGRR